MKDRLKSKYFMVKVATICLVTLIAMTCYSVYTMPESPKCKVLNGNLSMEIVGDDNDFINPSKVLITHLGTGDILKVKLTLYNGENRPKVIAVSQRTPDSITDGYMALDIESGIWVTPTVNRVNLEPFQTKTIVILAGINKGTDKLVLKGDFETWISTKEATDAQISKELVLRVLVKH